jgi:hypothetical protein
MMAEADVALRLLATNGRVKRPSADARLGLR